MKGIIHSIAYFLRVRPDPPINATSLSNPGGATYPTPEDYEALVEAGNGALENTRALLKEVGPITVPLLPKLPAPPKAQPVAHQQQVAKPAAVEKGSGKEAGGKRNGSGGSGSGGGRKGAQNVPADVIAAVTKGKRKSAAADVDSAEKKKPVCALFGSCLD